MNNKWILLFAFLILIIPGFLFSQSTDALEKSILKKKAVEYKKEINFIKSQSFYQKKEWDSTLIYSMKQLSSTNKKELIDFSHYFRGTSFIQKKLHKEAKKELLLISDKFEFYLNARILLATSFLELREFKAALLHYENVLKLPEISKQPHHLSKAYEGLGITYFFLEKYDSAENYLVKSLEIKEKQKNETELLNAYNAMANLYYVQYKDSQAIPYFEKAYALSKKVKNISKKAMAAENMAAVEENRNNYKKALAYKKESDQWKDSLNNQNKVWAVADFEKKFAVAQKQKEIKVLQVENELKNSQRNGFFFAAIGLLLLLTGGVYLYSQKVKNSKIILLQKNKLDELNATKDQLFSIVSHDLRSSVHALKASNAKLSETLETKNYDELNQLIVQNSGIANSAYSLLDNLLHWAMLQTKQLYFHKESVHLHSIVQQIEYNYKPLLLDKALDFENLVSKNVFIFVDLDSVKIVLRNLLDNAIKFSKQNGKITFYTQEINTDLCQLIIEDTGIGMNEITIEELLQENELLAKKRNSENIGTGLGLQLCKQMIKKNGGTIAIESAPDKGTKMNLSFPKTKNNG